MPPRARNPLGNLGNLGNLGMQIDPDEELECARAKEVLRAKLQSGVECETETMEFITNGGSPDDLILPALGNRDTKALPCLKTLKTLLEWRGDPNVVDSNVGSPAIHLAAWHGSAEAVGLLLDAGADLEAGERGGETPPLNTALAAGNAKVALMLLSRKANVQWKHPDGATCLHVAAAWLTDADGARRRMVPSGDDPRALVAALLYNGVDPTQREGMRGLTPFDAFRGSLPRSPWLAGDEKLKIEFARSAEEVTRLLAAADDAMKKKAKGNTALKEKKYDEALEEWSNGRRLLEAEGLSGHHVAVFWSNQAICYKAMGDMARCQSASQEGLTHYCSHSVRSKLEKHATDSAAEMDGMPFDLEPLKPKEEKKPVEAEPRPKPKPKATESQMKKGFLSDKKGDLYGPDGSVQGQMPLFYNDARGIKIPINQPGGKGPKPIIVPMPEMNSDSEEEKQK